MSKQQQLDALARFSGLTRYSEYSNSPWMNHGTLHCPYAAWNPHKNPRDTWLVLEALVRWNEKRWKGGRSYYGWPSLLQKLANQADATFRQGKDFNFASAICETAEEVAKSRKGPSDED